MGYHKAGFALLGMDVFPMPDYPAQFTFILDNALKAPYPPVHAIHASPPCQEFTQANTLKPNRESKQMNLIPDTRQRLQDSGLPYIIENVPGAPLNTSLLLCGSMFNLKVRRHRIFETNFFVTQPQCNHTRTPAIGVYHNLNDKPPGGGTIATTLTQAQDAMGIDWMPWRYLTQAIPPAYTQYIGNYLLEYLRRENPEATTPRTSDLEVGTSKTPGSNSPNPASSLMVPSRGPWQRKNTDGG